MTHFARWRARGPCGRRLRKRGAAQPPGRSPRWGGGGGGLGDVACSLVPPGLSEGSVCSRPSATRFSVACLGLVETDSARPTLALGRPRPLAPAVQVLTSAPCSFRCGRRVAAPRVLRSREAPRGVGVSLRGTGVAAPPGSSRPPPAPHVGPSGAARRRRAVLSPRLSLLTRRFIRTGAGGRVLVFVTRCEAPFAPAWWP